MSDATRTVRRQPRRRGAGAPTPGHRLLTMFTALFLVISLLGSIAPGIATAQDAGTPAPEVTEEPAVVPAQTTEQPAAEQPAESAPVEQPAQEAAPSVEQPAEEPAAEQPAAELPAEEAAPVEQPIDDTSTVMTEVAPEPVEVAAAPVNCLVAEGVSPWIASDLADYPPGAWVSLIGGSWAPGQTVEIFVDDDGVADAVMGEWSHFTTVTADGSGAFTYGFSLPEWFVANYSVTATGECSQAATTFTDGNVRVAVSGITSATISWEKFNGSTTCSGIPTSSGSVSTGANFTTAAAADPGQSVRLTVPSVDGFNFQGWSSGDTTAQLCVAGTNGTQNRTANYVTATVVKQNQTITFDSTPPTTPKVGDTYTPLATATSGLSVSVGASGSCSLTGGVVTMTGVGTCTITADQGGNASYNAAPQATQILTVGKATATVTLSNLAHTYDGSAKTATASTNPSGLDVDVTYDGLATAPTSAGSYEVVATINNANHEGTTSGTLVIGQAEATITLSDLEHIYDGAAKAATVTTEPANLDYDITYDGSATAPTAAGSYAVVVSIKDANYEGSASGTLVITKATATVSLTNLEHVYDGETKAAIVTTDPERLEVDVTVTYNGESDLPVAAGTYAVVATLDHANYSGDTSGTLVIAKGTATVNLSDLEHVYDGAAKTATVITEPIGLNFNITYDGSATAPSAAGEYAVEVTIDDANYEGTTSGTLVIAKADQSISFDSLPQGNAKFNESYMPSATATSSLPVTLAASGACSLDETSGTVTMTGVGECAVTADQAGNANYNAAPQVIQRFDVNKATASITLNGLAATYDGSAKTVTATTTPVGLDVTITYDGSATAPSAAGSYAVVATIDDANHEGTTSGTLVIAKAGQTISFPTIASKKFGDAPFTLSASSDSGLTVSFGAEGACTISGATVTITEAGTCTVTASQIGDANYNAAANAVQNVSIAKATWTVKGFYQPLDGNGVVNTAKGGSTIPVKFEVFQGDTEITDPSKVKILVQTTTCPNSTLAVDPVEEIVTGTSGLRYDPTSGQFIYNWKTPKSAGSCYTLAVAAAGTNEEIPGTPSALVKLK